MLLLSLDSFLLLFITFPIGLLFQHGLEKSFHTTVNCNLLGIFLLGLIASTFYFNVLSLWRPVNHLSLIPLSVLSLVICISLREKVRQTLHSARRALQFIFSPSCRIITICILAILFFYWILPPGNPDSRGYHYLAIRWYEKYKIVPGLVNIDHRLAFNPAAFIIQSAYSFTDITGQSLYPLNGVLLGLFFLWLLILMLRKKDTPEGLIYGAMIFVLLTPLLPNIASPSSDPLVAACICFALLQLFRAVREGSTGLSQMLVPIVVLLYSITAKLSSLPVLLVLPYILFLLPGMDKKISFLYKGTILAALLYIPWLARNYILSGYLIFPYPHPDWFHPDWKAPQGVLKLANYYISTDAKAPNQLLSAQLPFPQWVGPWFRMFLKHGTPWDPLFFILSILSPVYWLILYVRSKKVEIRPLILWCIVYAGLWIWFLSAPTLRFGAVLMSFSIAIPALVFFSGSPQNDRKYILALRCLFASALIFYITTGCLKPSTYRFTLQDCWLYPLKDIAADDRQKTDFPFKMLYPGRIKLYIGNWTHRCMNVDQPCIQERYGNIETRGDRIDQGFRLTTDEVEQYYPFLR